jgi:hypothetical protein
MQNAIKNEYLTRDHILKLLSEGEVASVSTPETTACLADGDEYLDLQQLHEGVQCAGSSAAPMGQVLPRKSIHESTWAKILSQLKAPPS